MISVKSKKKMKIEKLKENKKIFNKGNSNYGNSNCSQCGVYLDNVSGIHLDSSSDYQNKIYCSRCVISLIYPFDQIGEILHQIDFVGYKIEEHKIESNFTFNNFNTDIGIYLYCLEDNRVLSTMYKFTWPDNFKILINSNKVITSDKNNIDITGLIKEENNIQILPYKTKTNLTTEKKYTFIILEMKQQDLSKLTTNKSKLNKSQCKKKQIEMMKENLISKEKFSITCPYTRTLINQPVKGKECNHFQCFEFNTYIQINKVRRKFKCPICMKICFVQDLYEDKFFLSIIKEILELKSKEEETEFYITDEGKYIPIKYN